MHRPRDPLANIVAAFAQTVTDRVTEPSEMLGGLTAFAAAALTSIDKEPGISIDALARVLDYSHSGMVRLIDRLVGDGLVRRSRAAADARQVALSATRTGRRHARTIHARRIDWVEELLAQLAARERDELRTIVSKLLARMTSGRESADYTCRLCDESLCTPDRCPVELAV